MKIFQVFYKFFIDFKKLYFIYFAILFFGAFSAYLQATALLLLNQLSNKNSPESNFQYFEKIFGFSFINNFFPFFISLIALSFVLAYFQNVLCLRLWRKYQIHCIISLLNSYKNARFKFGLESIKGLPIKNLLRETQRIGAFSRAFCNFTSSSIQSVIILCSLFLLNFNMSIRLFSLAIIPSTLILYIYAKKTSNAARNVKKLTRNYNQEFTNNINSILDQSIQEIDIKQGSMPIIYERITSFTERFENAETAKLCISLIFISLFFLIGFKTSFFSIGDGSGLNLLSYLALSFVGLKYFSSSISTLASLGRFYPYLEAHFILRSIFITCLDSNELKNKIENIPWIAQNKELIDQDDDDDA